MDHRFVALKATDNEETAVRVFKAEDRTALPVTDSAGVLIGIVTVDDVFDVAEAGGDRGNPAVRRIRGPERAYMDIAFSADGAEARGLAHGALPRRDADGDGDGLLREGDRQGGRAGAVRAADHFERRQLRLAGVDAGDPRAGARRGDAARLVARHAARDGRGPGARRHPGQRSASCGLPSGRRSRPFTASTGCWSPRPSRWRWSASCCGAR